MSHRRVNSLETMQNFNLGDVVTGVVQSVKPYGAFLDIGGTMGLLHISQITHERLTTVEQVLQVRHTGRTTAALAGRPRACRTAGCTGYARQHGCCCDAGRLGSHGQVHSMKH